MRSPTFLNRPRAALAALALALLALALPVATADAASGTVDLGEKPPSFSMEMTVPGTHGYRIGIGADNHRTVTVIAFKGDAYATYEVAGRVTSDRIEANFGDLGRISVRFTPSNGRGGRANRGGARKQKRQCEIRGHFDGVIRFRGELGYTQVSAKRAPGTVNPDGNSGCPRKRTSTRPGFGSLLAKAGGDPALTFTALGAVARSDGRQVTFSDAELNEVVAGQVVPFLTLVGASVEEHRGRIAIERIALLILERPVATPSPPGQVPQTATVSVPKPFQGTGSYLAAPGIAPTWSGDLAVPLPGAGLVPLAGPEFKSLLCAGPLNNANAACLNELESLTGQSSSAG